MSGAVVTRACAIAGVLLLLAADALPQATASSNPLLGKRLHVNPDTPARRQASQWQRSRPQDAALMMRMAEQPQSIWLGEWDGNIRRVVENHMNVATRSGALAVFVAYSIPHRDCGLYSRGGARGATEYRRWILDIARALNGRTAVVILEPDGLAAIECLPARLADERYMLFREAVAVLTRAGALVYVDAGNGNWQQPAEIATRLGNANIRNAQGFSLNVSNFHGTSVNVAYGNRVSGLVGGKHYVIDTSRNGREAAIEPEWCNAPNQALGRAPTTNTGLPLADAFLWIKTPGQSDGTCNNGPRAGEWWPDYALGLARTATALGSLTRSYLPSQGPR